MKTQTIAAFGFAAMTLAGIVAWRSFDGQLEQPTQPASQQGASPQANEPTFSPVEHPRGESAAGEVVANERRPTSVGAVSQADQASPVVPTALSTEHQELIGLGSPSGKDPFHEMLEKERKDPAWAYDMEQRLRLMYESQGAQIYLIECRTTLCEVQSFSGRSRAEARAAEPESGTIRPSLSSGMQINGRATELAYFRRDDIDQQLEIEAQRSAARQ